MAEEGAHLAKPGEEVPLAGKNPSFLSGLKATHETVKLYVGLIGLIGGVPAAVLVLDKQYFHNLLVSGAFCVIPALLILLWLFPKWREERNKRRAIEFGIHGQVKDPEYFRLTPYESDADFRRADHFQDAVYTWLSTSTAPLLYLSGASGSGKSSIISGWVLPKLIRDRVPTHIVKARVVGNPMSAIAQALLQPGAIWERSPPTGEQNLPDLLQKSCKRIAPRKLLLVLDQFEEFLILSDENERSTFATLLRSLAESPPPNLQILMILRSDYRPLLDALELPEHEKDRKEVPAFFESDAMTFLRDSGLKLSEALESEIRKEASEVEQTPGLIRPITINLFGLVLRRFEVLPQNYRQGTLLRSYLRELIQKKEIRDFAPQILRCMITDNGTKLPVACAEVAGRLGLDSNQVRGCLVQLGNEGVVRELGRLRGKWEIAHDFIAGLYFQILAGWRASIWRRGRPWIIGAGIALWLIAVVLLPGLVSAWRENQAVHSLAELGFSSGPCGQLDSAKPGCLVITASHNVNASTLGAAIPYLNRLTALPRLDLGFTKVENIDALKGLRGLRSLYLAETKVENIDALKGLSGLQRLYLFRTKVENIDALKGLTGLQMLDLTNTKVENIDALKGLTGLQELSLSDTKVENIEVLKGLSGLQQLNLSGTKVGNIDALKGLTGLQRLYLADTKVENIEALKGLSGLQQLSLSGTKVGNIDALKGMSGLQQLNLYGTKVENIDALKGLSGLQGLNLVGTKVGNIDALKGLTGLQQLYLAGTKVENIDALKGLTGLQQLDLTNTKVENIDALRAALPKARIVGP